jgi:hypothetical protein
MNKFNDITDEKINWETRGERKVWGDYQDTEIIGIEDWLSETSHEAVNLLSKNTSRKEATDRIYQFIKAQEEYLRNERAKALVDASRSHEASEEIDKFNIDGKNFLDNYALNRISGNELLRTLKDLIQKMKDSSLKARYE